MIIAMAGHVDHGKTNLVKAITGTDTDRLPQEKLRGMTIDIGFAHLDVPGHEGISLIDVPGHERFTHNMLAGVAGIDAALLVVAADDGIMPQTMEHLEILDLLGVSHGAVVITKTDRVASARTACVADAVRHALAGSTLRQAPVFPASCATGAGLPALLAWLNDEAARQQNHADPDHFFRMPIDRAFTVAGSGTVVTGTVQSGTVEQGDLLAIALTGRQVRVRGLQRHGLAAGYASRGQRCALNLAEVETAEVARGQWVVSAQAQSATSCFGARVRVLASARQALAHWTPVHLHHGTADVLARIATVGEAPIAPGQSALARIITAQPIHALHGDRFILRDNGAHHTLGGGMVLDPFSPRKRRRRDDATTRVYERPSAAGVLAGLLELGENGVRVPAFARALNLTPGALAAAVRATRAIVLGRQASVAISPGLADALTVRAIAAVRAFHTHHPRAAGIPLRELAAQVAPKLDDAAFAAFVRGAADRRLVALSNDVVSLRTHDSAATEEDERLWRRVRAALAASGARNPPLADLAASLRIGERVLLDFLHRKRRGGEIRCIAPRRFCLRDTLAALANTAAALTRESPGNEFTASEFRDAIGTGRGLAILYLEYFDQIGVTRRAGDRRRVTSDYADHLCPAEHALSGKSAPGRASVGK